MRLTKILSALLLVSLCSFSSIGKTPPAWKFIAGKQVNFRNDHDVIMLGNQQDTYRQLKLKISDGPLKLHDMKVYFDNGSVQDVPLQGNYRQGSESQVVDLQGDLRHLDRIEFRYETKGFWHGKSRVAVWGKR
jgi:hypothetical protein